MSKPLTQLPASVGIGFKRLHFDALRASRTSLGFLEVHAENYMGAGGPPHAQLAALRADYALSIHGVGLSIGGAGPLNANHLNRLADLCKPRCQKHDFRSRVVANAQSWSISWTKSLTPSCLNLRML